MNQFGTLKSIEDQSVNFTLPQGKGFFEARYVRRREEYFIIYLSSHNGCNKGCAFCHLTATNQKYMNPASLEQYLEQARVVMNHYKTQNQARAVNFNWMARGEPLANETMLKQNQELLRALTQLSVENSLVPKFNVSTIMPREMKERRLSTLFSGNAPTIYYSLYSLDPSFRKKWLPGAIDPLLALDQLKEYQRDYSKIIKLHWAFIEGENDSRQNLEKIAEEIDKRNLIVDFNLVRYNPFSPAQGKESSIEVLQNSIEFLAKHFKGRVKIIDRVGFDVKASCGMFIK